MQASIGAPKWPAAAPAGTIRLRIKKGDQVSYFVLPYTPRSADALPKFHVQFSVPEEGSWLDEFRDAARAKLNSAKDAVTRAGNKIATTADTWKRSLILGIQEIGDLRREAGETSRESGVLSRRTISLDYESRSV